MVCVTDHNNYIHRFPLPHVMNGSLSFQDRNTHAGAGHGKLCPQRERPL
jgi:hypothetical protein